MATRSGCLATNWRPSAAVNAKIRCFLHRDETNDTIHLAVPDGTAWVVLVERMDSTQPVRTFNELGTRTPSHATSTGLSVLAHLPEAEVEALLAGGIEGYSPTTVVDPDELRAELATIRRRGYAVNLRRYRPQVAAVGTAILDHAGRAAACQFRRLAALG